MYGRMVMGVVRTTYLINEEGIIERHLQRLKQQMMLSEC